MQPHLEATRRRMEQQEVVLLIQDTTELDFTPHPADDMGCLNGEKRFGFYDHTQLAVTPQRLCLGVVSSEQFDRTPESLGQSVVRKHLPIEQKESFRWLTGYRLASQLQGELPTTRCVSIADREADIYDVFVEVTQHRTPADLIIRAHEDRCTPERDEEAGPQACRKVRAEARRSERRLTHTVNLSRTPKRAAREARWGATTTAVRTHHPAPKPSGTPSGK